MKGVFIYERNKIVRSDSYIVMNNLENVENLINTTEEKLYDLTENANSVLKDMYKINDILKIEKSFKIDKIYEDMNNIFEETESLLKYYREIIKVFNYTSPPLVVHQDISLLISNEFLNYKKKEKINCRILTAPVKVVLNDEKKYYEPDIIVVFENSKIKKDGCYGAPDIIVEIISKSTRKNDYELKKEIYLAEGVKEYLIIDPLRKITTIYSETKKIKKLFNENIEIENLHGLFINIEKMLNLYTNWV